MAVRTVEEIRRRLRDRICDLSPCESTWAMCVQIMDTLEDADGDRKRANEFWCAFMREKDGPGLASLIEATVDVI